MYQNAKQEAFWGPVEGRLMAMFEGVPDLTLAMLNEATQAWAEFDHNRKIHSEIAQTWLPYDESGVVKKRIGLPYPNAAGVLSTAGGIVATAGWWLPI